MNGTDENGTGAGNNTRQRDRSGTVKAVPCKTVLHTQAYVLASSCEFLEKVPKMSETTVITHRRSIVERGGCFQRRLFVCLSTQ